MDMADPETLIEIFRQQAAARLHQVEMTVANDRFDEDHKKHERRERQEKEERERLEQMVEATAAQMAAFHETLDAYDTATVRALMDNQKALDALRESREQMEAVAHRLPDGRMVFKTEDGKRVFDQDGAQLSQDVVHPDAVPESAPRWESYKRNKDTERALLEDRQRLHEYQSRLDETREAIAKGHVSADALTKMDADLRKAMPESVKAQLPGQFGKPDAPDTEQRLSRLLRRPALEALRVPAGP